MTFNIRHQQDIDQVAQDCIQLASFGCNIPRHAGQHIGLHPQALDQLYVFQRHGDLGRNGLTDIDLGGRKDSLVVGGV